MDQEKLVRAAYAVSNEDGDRMIALLEAHGIRAVRQGGSRDIYTLKSVYGEEIMVPEETLEQAQELLKDCPAQKTERAGESSQEENGKKASLRTVISWLVVAAVLAAILWPVIQSRL